MISQIGRGGMGVLVGDHFIKHVALKVFRSGIVGEDAIRRFKNERQILASLEPPSQTVGSEAQLKAACLT